MRDEDKTKEQLVKELVELRERLAELEAAETNRKQTEERYRHLYGQSPIGIGLASPDGKVVSGNKANEVTIVFSGDAGKLAKEFLTKRKEEFMIFGPPEEIERSLQRILEIADVVIPGHDRPLRVIDHKYVGWGDNIGLELIIL